MPRSLPAPPSTRADWSPSQPNIETLTLNLRVITPLFGGGATPRVVDQDNPIRAAAIRGHLRFWWRATVGAKCQTAAELFQEEENLWGSAEKPGSVTTAINVQPGWTLQACAEYGWNRNKERYNAFPTFYDDWPSYALYPFQGKSPGLEGDDVPAEAGVGLAFRLTLRYPVDKENEVKQSVAAWIQFGGVGARSRRGCGSLDTEDTLPSLSEQATPHSNLLTCVPVQRMLGPKTSDPIRAWIAAVKVYRDFRQAEGFARNPASYNPMRPGRSRWPEPDAVRRIAGRNSPNHTPAHPVNYGFPRADLGLPIIFHFESTAVRNGDPQDATLDGPENGLRRFASPIITKAVCVEKGVFRPMVVILQAPHVWEMGNLRLSYKDASGRVQSRPVPQAEVELPGLRSKVSPLVKGEQAREALAEYTLKQAGWSRESMP